MIDESKSTLPLARGAQLIEVGAIEFKGGSPAFDIYRDALSSLTEGRWVVLVTQDISPANVQ